MSQLMEQNALRDQQLFLAMSVLHVLGLLLAACWICFACRQVVVFPLIVRLLA
jgi:hypothetical protein